ncbi:MAG: inorganic phosphate transporter, partial [Bacteroidales bacterium]|nr:inorganic phosphate transporter [Bacteroidales bacterium]
MEIVYSVLVVFLGLLAISDLVVGVSNDAANFMNSAIGSKAAPYKIIMIVVSLGIIIGATFSSGMMEIARSGIFHPEKFFFMEVMVIFIAVMMADVILLDIFNTFGLPTSTTVSIIFDLLGAAVGVTLFKLLQDGSGLDDMASYINTGKSLAIVSGILVSVVVAFGAGTFIQYLVRIFFTFNYQKTYRYFGAVFGGISIVSILYFMVMKGLKGASFMRPEYIEWINLHSLEILLTIFIGFSLIFQVLILWFRTNIFPFLILAGTFALAFAFAGNDLVNFIGVPLAGWDSFKLWVAGGIPADAFSMEGLNESIKTPTYVLLFAGIVMALTLWISKKARKVVNTSINLSDQSRQSVEKEQFESSVLARAVVRTGIQLGNSASYFIPSAVKKILNKRFRPKVTRNQEELNLPFDQVRATVNLVVSSVLIASATSLQLPLSTTYVTFMVAMGSSLSDRAWDRETAVFRISGVITVIGGWFFTAFSAFTVAFL